MIEQRILDFIDGKLGFSDEEELLHTLAVSPERRSLLKQHLRLRELTGSLASHSSLMVPPATTAGLFTKLESQGFTGPLPLPIADPAVPFITPMGVESAVAISAMSGLKILTYGAGLVAMFLLGLSLNYFGSIKQPPVGVSKSVAANINTTTTPVQQSGIVNTLNSASTQIEGGSVRGIAGAATLHRTRINPIRSQVSEQSLPTQQKTTESPSQPELSAAKLDISNAHIYAPFKSAELNVSSEMSSAERVSDLGLRQNIRPFESDESEAQKTYPLYLALRTGGGYSPKWGTTHLSTLSEFKLTWKPFDWLAAKASIGDLTGYETVANDVRGSNGIIVVGTSPSLNFTLVGSFELGIDGTVLGVPMELAAGLGADQTGLIYPRGSLFGSIRLGGGMMMNLGFEGMTYIHDVTSSVNAKVQSLNGTAAVQQHTTAERLGFFGPALEFSWKP
jgi:hypothetical protein